MSGKSRLLSAEFPNCHNFRDMGGIRTASGKTTRSGLIYRSGRLSFLSDEELTRFSVIGIRNIIDLRSYDEISAHPDRLPDNAAYLPVYAEIPEFSLESVIQLFRDAAAGKADTEMFIINSYRKMPNLLGQLFRKLFAVLTSPEYIPTLIHCTGGKDRTGLFAALFLYALGVGDKEVMQDYLLSGHVGKHLTKASVRYSGSFRQFGVEVPPEVTYPLLTSKPEYLQAALDAIISEYGSITEYLEIVAAVGVDELKRLRDVFLI
ncbi:MAG: tyrosine-protein phosphatase [Bacteroidetes bacterium]|nr:tyrosine-protein phosphatase [Bacteroidota bacterium]